MASDIPQRAVDTASKVNCDLWATATSEARHKIDTTIIARALLEAEARGAERMKERAAVEMDRRETDNANTPSTKAAYRNAATAIRNLEASND